MRYGIYIGVVALHLLSGCCGPRSPARILNDPHMARSVVNHDVVDILSKVQTVCCVPIRTSQERDGANRDSPFGFGCDDAANAEGFDVSDLAELIIQSTGGDEAWGSSGCTLVPLGNQLLANATPPLHEAMQQFLAQLRSSE